MCKPKEKTCEVQKLEQRNILQFANWFFHDIQEMWFCEQTYQKQSRKSHEVPFKPDIQRIFSYFLQSPCSFLYKITQLISHLFNLNKTWQKFWHSTGYRSYTSAAQPVGREAISDRPRSISKCYSCVLDLKIIALWLCDNILYAGSSFAIIVNYMHINCFFSH